MPHEIYVIVRDVRRGRRRHLQAVDDTVGPAPRAGNVRRVDPRTRRYVVLAALLLMILVVALGALF